MPCYDCAYLCCVDVSVNTYNIYAYVLTSVCVRLPMSAHNTMKVSTCLYLHVRIPNHECVRAWVRVRVPVDARKNEWPASVSCIYGLGFSVTMHVREVGGAKTALGLHWTLFKKMIIIISINSRELYYWLYIGQFYFTIIRQKGKVTRACHFAKTGYYYISYYWICACCFTD